MKLSKKKHIILMILLVLVAVFSVSFMKNRAYREKTQRIAVVFPKLPQQDISMLQEGIRDYAYENQVQLDTWYRSQMSAKELQQLAEEEKKNHSIGILLVYPEKYLKKQKDGDAYEDVLAITDTMQESFKNYATFAEIKAETVRLPIEKSVLETIANGKKENIYLENTYQLGYESMHMIAKYGKQKQLGTICINPIELNKETLGDGRLDALLVD